MKTLIRTLSLALILTFIVFCVTAVIQWLPNTIRFYSEVPTNQIVDNLFKMSWEDVEGDEYQEWVCDTFSETPTWAHPFQDRPSYCFDGGTI